MNVFFILSQNNSVNKNNPYFKFSSPNLLPFENVKIAVFATYLCIGAVIGAIGSVISTNKHLKV